MILVVHAVRLLVRNPRRTVTAMVGSALAAGLMSSVLLFGTASGTTVVRRALVDVPIDEQVVLATGVDPASVVSSVSADPAVRHTNRFDLVHINSAELTKAGSATQTSSGVIVGLGPDYSARTGLFGVSEGALRAGQIVISRDLASNLGAVPGDEVAFALAGGKSIKLTVSGVVDSSGADLILGPLDTAHRAAGANPPANVAVMAIGDLESAVLPLVPSGATADDPAAASGGATPVFAAEPAVRREIHIQLDHALIPGEPVAAKQWLDVVRRRLDRQGTGAFQTIDDASATLEPLAADLAWGEILFLFLALPGIGLAIALVRLAADATKDSTRRHAALLRARGVTNQGLVVVFGASTLLASLVGALIGVGAGILVAIGLFGADLAAAGAPAAIGVVALGTTIATTLLGGLAAALPLREQLQAEIAANRADLVRDQVALWQRLRLDFLLVAAGVLVFGLTAAGGVRPVIGTEGNPTVTLALSAFVGPLLLWIGGTLFLLRVAVTLARRGTVRRVLGRMVGPAGDFAGASIRARARTVAPAIVVVALAVGFGTSVLLFDATYLQQQRVDARLTLGADLKAVPATPSTADAVAKLAGPGIRLATPFVDRVVYVGPEAQDLLAIDPNQLPSVATLADAFFAGTTAADAMAALRSQADGILVSSETAKDYSIVVGDRVRIRIPDATGILREVDFRMAGIALEFPTAPKDAFLVANLAYVRAQTGNDRISFILASASGDVTDAGRRLATRLGPGWEITDLTTTTARLANEITSVDLAGLVALDVGFAVLIAALGMALFLFAGLADRRRELATLIAIGAEPGQVQASVASEAAAIAIAGGVVGLMTGAIVGLSLVQILTGVFDPPPDVPAVPWAELAGLLAVVAVATAAASAAGGHALRRLDVVAALRER